MPGVRIYPFTFEIQLTTYTSHPTTDYVFHKKYFSPAAFSIYSIGAGCSYWPAGIFNCKKLALGSGFVCSYWRWCLFTHLICAGTVYIPENKTHL